MKYNSLDQQLRNLQVVKKTNNLSYAEIKEKIIEVAKMDVFPSILARDNESYFDKLLWEKIARTGIFSSNITKSRENEDELSLAQEVSLYYEFAKHSCDLPLALSLVASGAVAIELINRYGSELLKERYIPKLISGESIAAVANSECSGGTDLKSLSSYVLKEKDSYSLKLDKSGASNVGVADIVIFSGWLIEDGSKNTLEVFVSNHEEIHQVSHVDKLSGFRTGATGALSSSQKWSGLDYHLIGSKGTGFKILKHCFNVERLFVGAIIAGVIEAMIEKGIIFLSKKKSMGAPLSEYQYMQEKIISIYKAKEAICAMIDSITRSLPSNDKSLLDEQSNKLCVLKILAIEQGLIAAQAFFEIFGYQAYTKSHLAQKILRDMNAFTYLGGTKEQQKIILFKDLLRGYTDDAKKIH